MLQLFPPSPACLCIRATGQQKKHGLVRMIPLVADTLGSLIFNLLIVCIAVTDGGDVVAFRYESDSCSISGQVLWGLPSACRLRTVPPAVASRNTKAYMYC